MEFRLLGNLEVVIDGAPSTSVAPSRARCSPCCWWPRDGSSWPSRSSRPCGATARPTRRPERCRATSRGCGALVPGGARRGGEGAGLGPAGTSPWSRPTPSTRGGSRRWPSGAGRCWRERRGRLRAARGGVGAVAGAALLEFSHLDFAWVRRPPRGAAPRRHRGPHRRRSAPRPPRAVVASGELVAANPLREQFRHHMALALYRSGRQAEALRILDDARRTLRNQLGIDPGRPLVELESAILAQDTALTLDPATSPVPARRPRPPPRGGALADDGGRAPAPSCRRARSSCGRPSPPWTRRARRRGSCWSRASRASARPACWRS